MTPNKRNPSNESPRPLPEDSLPEDTPESAADDRATAVDHDVPDETVIDKTLPEPPRDKQRPE